MTPAPSASTSPADRITTRRRGRRCRPCTHAERLGAGAGVGDHQRGEHGDDDRGDRQVVAAAGELVGDGGEHDALLDAVERRVEEGAERRALARHPRVAAVERVANRADDERDPAQQVVVLPTSTAATTHSANPVSEIAFGVSRDSISRMRISAW